MPTQLVQSKTVLQTSKTTLYQTKEEVKKNDSSGSNNLTGLKKFTSTSKNMNQNTISFFENMISNIQTISLKSQKLNNDKEVDDYINKISNSLIGK